MNKKELTRMIKSSRLSASSGHNLPAPIQHFANHKIARSCDANELINRYIDYCNTLDTTGQDMHLCEHFVVLGLNRENKPIFIQTISTGGVHGTVADPKIIMAHLLINLCSGCILSHNHPSGRTGPSEEDKKITAQVKEACAFMSIALLDHIITTRDNGYTSFADEGML